MAMRVPNVASGSGFLDPADYPFVEMIERGAPAIRTELDALLQMDRFVASRHRFVPMGGSEGIAKMVYEEGWDVFAVCRFGKVMPANAALCPRTTEMVRQVPEIMTAGFSKLAAGGHIKPHSGTQDLVRCHLGLIVPPECRFRVGDEIRAWEENKCLLFDNLMEHEVWNPSDRERIVLVLDFLKRR